MPTVYEYVKRAKYVWIYGAGIIGKQVAEFLDNPIFPIHIQGVVVTNKEVGCEKLGKFQIFDISEIDTPKTDSLFILAVSQKYQQEIKEVLSSKGYQTFICWQPRLQRLLWGISGCNFVDRRKNYSKVCFVLSGYKEYLWDNIFGRLRQFVPEDVEICLISSGIWKSELEKIANKNDWSYLSTKINSVTLIQNIAIELFENAQWIYKMDEDIFLTEGCFQRMMAAHREVEANDYYRVGIAAPLIPVNGYGFMRVLDRLNKLNEYEAKFEKPIYGGDYSKKIECSSAAAAYMWGLESDIPQLDRLNHMFSYLHKYSLCNVRFNIGFILFHRSFWNVMGGFDVSGMPDMGKDEDKIGYTCMNQSFAIAVAEDSVVGHFGFGNQTEKMKDYYEKRPEWFAVQEVIEQ